MAKTRVINFDLDDKYVYFDFGTYALMMYYAKQVDSANGKLLFDATSSEYWYRIDYELDTNGISNDDDTAHFEILELQQVVTFIDSSITKALSNEPQDLLVKYGGVKKFYDLFYSEVGFLGNISIDMDEFYDDNPINICYKFSRLNDLIKYAISINQAYTVSIS